MEDIVRRASAYIITGPMRKVLLVSGSIILLLIIDILLTGNNLKSFLIIWGLEVVVAVIVLWTITFIKRRENDLILPEDKSDDSKTTVHSLNDKLP